MSENTPLQGSGGHKVRWLCAWRESPGEGRAPHGEAGFDDQASARDRLLASLVVGAGWLDFATPALPVWLGGGMSV